MKLAISSDKAQRLILDYEEYVYRTSPCAVLHWVFSKTKCVLEKYNSRTMDKSKWEQTTFGSGEKDEEAKDNYEEKEVGEEEVECKPKIRPKRKRPEKYRVRFSQHYNTPN